MYQIISYPVLMASQVMNRQRVEKRSLEKGMSLQIFDKLPNLSPMDNDSPKG